MMKEFHWAGWFQILFFTRNWWYKLPMVQLTILVFREALETPILNWFIWKTSLTFQPNATLELGFSGITGHNFYDLRTNIAAMDLTYKWKPVQFNTYQSFTWQSEAYFSNADTLNHKTVNSFGMYSFINFQFSKRMFLQECIAILTNLIPQVLLRILIR